MKENNNQENAPVDWACYICGQYYKIGRFNKVFVFRFGEWVATRSTSLEMVHKAIEAKAKKITDPREKRKYVTHKRKDLPDKPVLNKESAVKLRNDVISKAPERYLVKRSLV